MFFWCALLPANGIQTVIVQQDAKIQLYSITKPNRLMLLREIIAVYCENYMEHADTLCGENAIYTNPVRTSQETHYVSTTKPNRLMLLREIIAVYCENYTEHADILLG
jgi:hypothetical protein